MRRTESYGHNLKGGGVHREQVDQQLIDTKVGQIVDAGRTLRENPLPRLQVRFGLGLLPNNHGLFHSLSRDVALAVEATLADALAELGCTVFGGH